MAGNVFNFFCFFLGLFRLHDGRSSRFQGPLRCAAVRGRFMSGRASGWPARGGCGARPPARLPGVVPCHRTRPPYQVAVPRETMPRPAARPPPTCPPNGGWLPAVLPPGGGAALRAPLRQPSGGGSPGRCGRKTDQNLSRQTQKAKKKIIVSTLVVDKPVSHHPHPLHHRHQKWRAAAVCPERLFEMRLADLEMWHRERCCCPRLGCTCPGHHFATHVRGEDNSDGTVPCPAVCTCTAIPVEASAASPSAPTPATLPAHVRPSVPWHVCRLCSSHPNTGS